jgi:cytochrome c553
VRRRDAVWPLAVGLAVLFSAAGCGSGGPAKQADLAHGRELFQGGAKGNLSCGFCHTLKAAATVGPFGPDLDQEGVEYRTKHMSQREIQDFVLNQIRHPTCLDPNDPSRCMPTDIVTGGDAADVAAFMAKCAGNSRAPGCRPLPGGLRGEAAKGERFYAILGCVSCHWSNGNVAVAPTFLDLAGSQVELADGTKVTADDTYLLESILLPDKKIVKGFAPGYMSSRVAPGQITAAQAKALIAYIKTQK